MTAELITSEAILASLREMDAPIVPEVETLAENVAGQLAHAGVTLRGGEVGEEQQEKVATTIARLFVRQEQFRGILLSQVGTEDDELTIQRVQYANLAVGVAVAILCDADAQVHTEAEYLWGYLKVYRDRLAEEPNA